MPPPNASTKTQDQGRGVYLKLGGVQILLNGPLSLIALLILLAIIAGILYLMFTRSGPGEWASAGLWIAFILYWSAAAKNAAATSSSESLSSRQTHQLLMYGALLIAILPVPGLMRRWLPLSPWIHVPIGLTIQMTAGFLAIWARKHLGRNWSGAITKKVDHQLVRTGPYKLLRHPIYSGMLGMFLGTAVVSGALHGLLGLLIMSFAYWRKIRLEEQSLREAFGAEYDDYRQKSWALIPGLF